MIIRPATTSNAPMVVDFTRLPSGETLFQKTDLKGDEFNAWGFQIAPDPSLNATCTDAKLQLLPSDNVNRLRPGLPSAQDTCTNLPIIFTVDQPIGSAAIQFFAPVIGTYKLEMFDSTGTKVDTTTIQATANAQVLIVRAPANAPAQSDVRKIIFSRPPTASVQVQTVIFALPNQLAPTVAP